MALEVYYPSDIRNALVAAKQSCGAALLAAGGEGSEFAQGFGEGYRAALTTIALAFGLVPLDSQIGGCDWQLRFLPTRARGTNPNVLARPPPLLTTR